MSKGAQAAIILSLLTVISSLLIAKYPTGQLHDVMIGYWWILVLTWMICGIIVSWIVWMELDDNKE